jgi:hypothetical protein
MNHFDDDDFEEMSEDERDELNKEYEAKRRAVQNHPLMKSGREVFDLLNTLIDTIEDEDKQSMFNYLREDATIMLTKIAGALASDSRLISLGNAAIIRQHAYTLLISTHTLGEFTDTDNSYIKLFRTEMESFKEVFKDWMREVHAMDRDGEEDDWGVFI